MLSLEETRKSVHLVYWLRQGNDFAHQMGILHQQICLSCKILRGNVLIVQIYSNVQRDYGYLCEPTARKCKTSFAQAQALHSSSDSHLAITTI